MKKEIKGFVHINQIENNSGYIGFYGVGDGLDGKNLESMHPANLVIYIPEKKVVIGKSDIEKAMHTHRANCNGMDRAINASFVAHLYRTLGLNEEKES